MAPILIVLFNELPLVFVEVVSDHLVVKKAAEVMILTVLYVIIVEVFDQTVSAPHLPKDRFLLGTKLVHMLTKNQFIIELMEHLQATSLLLYVHHHHLQVRIEIHVQQLHFIVYYAYGFARQLLCFKSLSLPFSLCLFKSVYSMIFFQQYTKLVAIVYIFIATINHNELFMLKKDHNQSKSSSCYIALQYSDYRSVFYQKYLLRTIFQHAWLKNSNNPDFLGIYYQNSFNYYIYSCHGGRIISSFILSIAALIYQRRESFSAYLLNLQMHQ